MTVIIQKRRSDLVYSVPAGGEILWNGIAANVPAGFSIDSYCYDVFIRGCASGAASDTPISNFSHTHTNPTSSGSNPNHTHTVGGGDTSSASGSSGFFPLGDYEVAPSGHSHSIPTHPSAAAGVHSHTLSPVSSAFAYPPYARLYWIKAAALAEIPVGGIIMLDAAIANRPEGFNICDGNGGTLDLRDKFIYGASADGQVGVNGGSETHQHGNVNSGSSGSHTHNVTTAFGSSGANADGSNEQGTQVSAPHDHTPSVTSDSDPNHAHGLNSTLQGTSVPSFLKLYFIMRTI